MSSPLAAGGQTFVLTPTGPAQMLTEYAGGPGSPLLLINTSTDLAWVAAHSGVGPQNGVPLEPGASLPWISEGQVWVIADPAAANPITVVATSAVAGWTPSPAAIAAATAIALAESGIPITASETVVAYNANVSVPNSWNIANYNSIIVLVRNNPAVILQLDSKGDVLDYQLVWPTTGPFGQGSPVRISAIGTSVTISPLNGSPSPVNLFLVGSTRTSARIDARLADAAGDEWSLSSFTPASGTNYPLNQTAGAQLQGLVFATFAISTAGGKGQFFLNYENPNGSVAQELCDDSQFVVPAAGSKFLTLLMAVPAVPYSLSFTARAAVALSVSARLVPGSI